MLKLIVFSATFLLCACAFASNVNVSSPIAGSTIAGPFSAIASCNVAGADAMQVYLDYSLVYSANGASMNAYIGASPGNHLVEVKCWVGPTSYSSGIYGFTVAQEAGTNEVPVASPFVNATVGTPFSVIAGCNVSGADAIQIYLDSSSVYTADATSVNHNLSASAGNHRLEVKCWVGGTSYSSGVYGITVAPQTGENPVVVSSPLPNATVGTSFSAIASCNVAGADAMQVYMDSAVVYEGPWAVTSTYANLNASIGDHQLEVKCWKGSTPYSSGIYQFAVGPEEGTSQVVVSSPLAGTREPETFNVTANCNVAGADAMQVYLDGSPVYSPDVTAINYLASASPEESHELEVKCWVGDTAYSSGVIMIDPADTSGSGFDGSPNIPIPPSFAHYAGNIDDLSNWNSATGAIPSCPNGVASSTCNPPNANYNPTVEHPADPASLAGSDNISALFELYNGPALGEVVWTKELFTNAKVSHFIWDIYLYVNSTNYGGSELDLLATANGYAFMMGSICYRPGNSYFTWNNAAQHWISNPSIPCNNLLTADTWHHITFYSTVNTSNNTYEYHVIRIDNVDYVLNQTQNAQETGWPDGVISVQAQLDANSSGAGVNEYLENVQLYAW
jgi:hypothetical protein